MGLRLSASKVTKMKELKVLYIVYRDFYKTGGTRRPLEVLRRIKRYQVDPYVILIQGSSDALKSLKKIIMNYCFWKKIELKDFNLIVSTSETPVNVILGYLMSKKLKLPWTVTIQLPINLKRTPATLIPVFKDPLWLPQQLLVSFMIKNTVPLTVSRSAILESTIKPDKFIEIKVPIAVDWEIIRQASPQKETFEALYMARLTSEKGLFDIPKIWKKVTEKIKDAKLVVAGRFEREREKNKFFNLMRAFGLGKNINYVGYLSEEKKFSFMKSAKVFVYPSRLDAFPIVVMEALACGAPVVAYDIPAITFNYPIESVTVVKKGDINAFASKVVQMLMMDKPTFDRYREVSKKFASNFTWDKVAEEEAKAYKEFLKLAGRNKTD